jgi:hypothetical protein
MTESTTILCIILVLAIVFLVVWLVRAPHAYQNKQLEQAYAFMEHMATHLAAKSAVEALQLENTRKLAEAEIQTEVADHQDKRAREQKAVREMVLDMQRLGSGVDPSIIEARRVAREAGIDPDDEESMSAYNARMGEG